MLKILLQKECEYYVAMTIIFTYILIIIDTKGKNSENTRLCTKL